MTPSPAQPSAPVLTVRGLSARYGNVLALRPVDLHLERSELVAVLGPNGAGKSTLLRALMGLTPGSGRVEFEGSPLPRNDPRAVTQRGVVLVPEGRGVFGPMTVRENLDLGAYLLKRNSGEFSARLERVFALLPRLRDRQTQLAGSLSGGEQQMLAIGRALVTNPRLLILDEATEGLAPLIREEIWRCLRLLREAGQTLLVVDKYVSRLVEIADHHVILEKGQVAWRGSSAELAADRSIWHRYLGV